jgi:hypothetical protein
MKIKHPGGPAEPPTKTPKITEKNRPEYERTRNAIVKALQRMGGYEPAIDDYYVDEIARNAIYAKKIETFLDSDTANVDTYSSVAYTKQKFAKMIENAIHQLALNRRDRLGNQTQSDMMRELRKALGEDLTAGGR